MHSTTSDPAAYLDAASTASVPSLAPRAMGSLGKIYTLVTKETRNTLGGFFVLKNFKKKTVEKKKKTYMKAIE